MDNQRYCLRLELQDDDELIRLYEQYHQPGAVWPEVLESIRASGIENMQIFRLDTHLVMVLDVKPSFSFETKAKLDSENPKVQEWERLMERFQKVDSQQQNAKWQPMQNIFDLQKNG
ncbi:L-rhamnose mutarotase [Aliiglaciecola lipolytica]|uniref:L-rhamnose mutarotase n=1 Tax=Aliiglaciecola lipolytica TaxID=477689 RepID=UPI001C09634D|nr:L-rhamnose mutarotase [Aliiglaciecola lipolytica]MBU2877950.1 L-rhamnose mutarotase [Aliiglaciecola lipolytica]